MEGHLKLHLQSLEILAQNPRSPQPYFALTLAPPIGSPLSLPLALPLSLPLALPLAIPLALV